MVSPDLPDRDLESDGERATLPGFNEVVLTCRVERWRGYITSRFYVLLGEDRVLESRPFRWRRAAPPPESKRARAAYDELAGRLAEEGWRLLEQGPHWFATTFARTVLVPSQRAGAHQPAPQAPRAVPRPRPLPKEEPPAPVESRVDEPALEPEPAVQLIADEAPVRDAQPRVRWRRRRSIMLSVPVVGAVAAAAVFLGGAHADGSATGGHQAPLVKGARAGVSAARASKPTAAAPVPAGPAAPAPSVVDVEVVAHGSGSWVEARRGSKSGHVIYLGTLAGGKRLHLRAPRVWAEFGAAGNLAITADGKPVVLRGTFDKLFRPASS